MTEKLVDVIEKRGTVLHVFPVEIDDPKALDRDYEARAIENAGHARIVPDDECAGLSARMHVSRSGPLEPDFDDLSVLLETKEHLCKVVEQRAFRLWQAAGEPEGQSETFWYEAEQQHLRERAYALLEREGRPHGKAHEHWCNVCSHQGI